MLESLVSVADMFVRLFAVLAALSAVVYFVSNRQLQNANTQERDLEQQQAEHRRAQLEAELSSAGRKIDELTARNAQIDVDLEQERETRLKVQRRFSPRYVTPAVASEMVAALKPFAGRKVNFGYFTELETAEFAEQIVDVLKAAGWKPQIFKIKKMQVLYGVECGGLNSADPALEALTEALKMVDKRAPAADNSLGPQFLQPQLSDQLWVMIGLKRPHLWRAPQPDSAPPVEQGNGAVDRD